MGGPDDVDVHRAVDKCRTRLADGAVKAASRAQRGRSNAERLDRADANLTIGIDGPRRTGRSDRLCRGFLDRVTVPEGVASGRRFVRIAAVCSDCVAAYR